MFAVDNAPAGSNSKLYRLDLSVTPGSSSVKQLVGQIWIGNQKPAVLGMTFSPSGTLYAWSSSNGLITIDPFTALATDVDGVIGGGTFIQSLAFDSSGTMYGAYDDLYVVDTVTGVATKVGGPVGFGGVRGIEFLPPGPVRYCTPKKNSCGTSPTIAATGTPSATAGSGFTVSATNARAGKFGLLLYTDAGAAAAPFSGGTLCLKAAQLKRSIAVQDTGGMPGLCDGVLALDVNAFAVGALGGNPLASLQLPGTRVHCQFWGRDTLGNNLLSDGLEFRLGP
jgi:hypothetical protein